MRFFNRMLWFAGCLVSISARADYVSVPRISENSAYKLVSITEAEYNGDTSGRVFKEYGLSDDGELVEQYYRYDINTEKAYDTVETHTSSGSGDGKILNINVGLGLNNETSHAPITGTLYKDNSYEFDYTGTGANENVRGAAVYNSGVIGEKDSSGAFTGTAIEADFVGNNITSQIETEGELHINGAALANQGEIGKIGGDFVANKAVGRYVEGGAVYNDADALIEEFDGDFVGNTGTGEVVKGGGLYNLGNVSEIAGNFIDNKVHGEIEADGGAIQNNDTGRITNINGNFIANEARADRQAFGGAIDNLGGYIGNISGVFSNNAAISEVNGSGYGEFGGAISSQEGNIGSIEGTFIKNRAETQYLANGGAIFSTDGSVGAISGTFKDNSAVAAQGGAYGGAVYGEFTDNAVKISNAEFLGNSAEGKYEALGGAVYVEGGAASIVDSSFYNNSAVSSNGDAMGGAVYLNSGTIAAKGKNVVFSGNTANGESNALYVEGDGTASGGVLNLVADTDRKIIFNDGIDGENYSIYAWGEGLNSEIVFNDIVKNADYFEIGTNGTVRLGTGAEINTKKYVAEIGENNGHLTLDLEVDRANNTIHNGVINVGGDIEGETKVTINSLNSDMLDNKEDAVTVFVNAPNDSVKNDNAFKVERVIGSPYAWNAFRNYNDETEGSTWYLALLGKGEDGGETGDGGQGNGGQGGKYEYMPEIPAYVGMQAAAVEQSRGLNRSVAAGLRANRQKGCCDAKYRYKHDAWVSVDYASAEIDAPESMDAEVKGITAGFDLGADYYQRVGVFGSYRQGEYDLSGEGMLKSAYGGSELNIDSYLGGLYYQYDKNRLMVLATLFGGVQDISAKADNGSAKADTNAKQFGASFDIARRFYMPYSWIIEPSLGLYYTGINIDGFTDNVKNQVDFDVMHYVEAELGLRFEHLFCLNGLTSKFYLKPSVIQTFASGDSVDISGLSSIATYDTQTLGRMEIGAKFGLFKSWSAYTSGNYTFGSDYSAYGINAGLTYAW